MTLTTSRGRPVSTAASTQPSLRREGSGRRRSSATRVATRFRRAGEPWAARCGRGASLGPQLPLRGGVENPLRRPAPELRENEEPVRITRRNRRKAKRMSTRTARGIRIDRQDDRGADGEQAVAPDACKEGVEFLTRNLARVPSFPARRARPLLAVTDECRGLAVAGDSDGWFSHRRILLRGDGIAVAHRETQILTCPHSLLRSRHGPTRGR